MSRNSQAGSSLMPFGGWQEGSPTFKLDSTLAFFLDRTGTSGVTFSPSRKVRKLHWASKMAQAKGVGASSSIVPGNVQW